MNAAAKDEARRRAQLAKIHVGRKRLGLDDIVYRALLKRLTGKSSAAELDEAQRGRVLDHFKSLGFLEGNSFTKKLDDFQDREPQARLIRCLWADCVAAGIVRDASDRALRKFIRRTAKIDSIEWLSPHQANLIIEGLKSMRSRRSAKAIAH